MVNYVDEETRDEDAPKPYRLVQVSIFGEDGQRLGDERDPVNAHSSIVKNLISEHPVVRIHRRRKVIVVTSLS